jgi:hypothetical protein
MSFLKKFIPSRTNRNDYLADLSKGLAVGSVAFNVAGLSSSFNTGTAELWENGLTRFVYLASEETMTYVSTDANDTLLGSGARAIFVSGVNDAGDTVTEFIEMDGLTPVAGTVPFAVINFMFCIPDSGGVGAANVGTITATASVSATAQCIIRTLAGISKHGLYRVPNGKKVVFKSIEINGSKSTGGTSPLLRFNVFARFTPTTPWISIFERALDAAKSPTLQILQPVSGVIESGADLRFTCTTDQNSSFAYLRILGIEYEA